MDSVNVNPNENQAPVSPTMPPTVQTGAPVTAPTMPTTPVEPVAQAPVEPIPATNSSVPEIDPSLIEQDTIGMSSSNVMVGATDPITMPNPPKAPDPIEEELKAPMTAAAPVPGSIGSAISMPAEKQSEDVDLEAIAKSGALANNATQTPVAGAVGTMPQMPSPEPTNVLPQMSNVEPVNATPQMPNVQPMNTVPQASNPELMTNNAPQVPNVAFNDPANAQAQPSQNPMASQVPVAKAKKKMDKKTLIMLCAVAGLAVVALVIVLIMTLNS